MHSLSGIETAPITASARPICAGYIDTMLNEWIADRRCRAVTYRKGQAALVERRVRHEHEGVIEASARESKGTASHEDGTEDGYRKQFAHAERLKISDIGHDVDDCGIG